MKTFPEIEKAYNAIIESLVFRTNGEHIDLCESLQTLCAALQEVEDGIMWELGEGNECDLAALLIGSYWALTEWHGGQNSPEYAAQCAIASIYSPNMANGPESDTGEETAYCLASKYFAAKNGVTWDDERDFDYNDYTGFTHTGRGTLTIENVDFAQLEIQRRQLAQVVLSQTLTVDLTESQVEALEGILNMLDHWSDTVARKGGAL